MKQLSFVFVAIFILASCMNSQQVYDNPESDFDINDYIGTFRISVINWTEEHPKLIITPKKDNNFTITIQGEYGGEYECRFDGYNPEDWGGGIWYRAFFDCKTVSSNYENWNKPPYLTPYISMKKYVSEYNGKYYSQISIAMYLRGKEYYKECSADEDKQACNYQGFSFFRQSTGK